MRKGTKDNGIAGRENSQRDSGKNNKSGKRGTGSRTAEAGAKTCKAGSIGEARPKKIRHCVKRTADTPAIKCAVGQQVFQAVGFLMRKAEAAVPERTVKRKWGHSCRNMNGLQ